MLHSSTTNPVAISHHQHKATTHSEAWLMMTAAEVEEEFEYASNSIFFASSSLSLLLSMY